MVHRATKQLCSRHCGGSGHLSAKLMLPPRSLNTPAIIPVTLAALRDDFPVVMSYGALTRDTVGFSARLQSTEPPQMILSLFGRSDGESHIVRANVQE